MEGLLRSVSSAISDRFYSFFSLTSASSAADDEDEKESEGDNVSLNSESDADIDEELRTRLVSLYGLATPTACSQARDVLVNEFNGNVGLFLTQFLTPAISLLDNVRQQVSDSYFSTPRASLSPASVTSQPAAETDTATEEEEDTAPGTPVEETIIFITATEETSFPFPAVPEPPASHPVAQNADTDDGNNTSTATTAQPPSTAPTTAQPPSTAPTTAAAPPPASAALASPTPTSAALYDEGDRLDVDEAEDDFWPLAYHDAALVHLCDSTPLSHLSTEGDFFFSLQLARRCLVDLEDADEEEDDDRTLSLVVKVQCSDGSVKEVPIMSQESEGGLKGVAGVKEAFSAMDWVNQARMAPDHELSYILRQCLIATEFTVRHLQWEETVNERTAAASATAGGGAGKGAGARAGIVHPHLLQNHASSHRHHQLQQQQPGGPCAVGARGGSSPALNQDWLSPQQQPGGDLLSPRSRGVMSPSASSCSPGGSPSLGLTPSSERVGGGSSLSDVSGNGGLPSQAGHGLGVSSPSPSFGFGGVPFHDRSGGGGGPSSASSPSPQGQGQGPAPGRASPSPSSLFSSSPSSSSYQTASLPRGSSMSQHHHQHQQQQQQQQEQAPVLPPRQGAFSEASSPAANSLLSLTLDPAPSLPRGANEGCAGSAGSDSSDSTLVGDDGYRRTNSTLSSGGGGGSGADVDGDRSRGSVSSDGGGRPGDMSPRSPRQNGNLSPGGRRSTPRGSPSGSVKDGSGTARHSSGYYTQRHVAPPDSVSDVDYHLLHSGIAILPGSSDRDGKRLIFIFTCSVLWHQRQVVSAELTRLLMYYYSIPKRDLVSQGITIVVDIRGATSSTVNILLESLYLFKDNVPNSLSVIHMLADKPTQSLVLKSPVYDPQSGVSVDVLLSHDHLQRSVSLDQLPSALDGTYPYSHEEWVRFRMKLEPFLTNCCAVAQFLVGVMQEVSSSDFLPRSTSKTRELMARHEQQVKAAFNDPRLLAIQNDGEAIMSSLRREESYCCHSEDYRFALEKVSSLYRQLQETMGRLAELAAARMHRLEQCLQLRGFEEECQKVLTWLQQDGQSLLERHSTTADNLKTIKGQQRDFEKLYFSAMTHIDKGNDLMEEAGVLAQTSGFSENALGYKDGARILKKQLQLFTAQLEDTRERIEGTSRCYSLLDKSYEWALEAMKYVASMRMEHCATASGLDKLLRSLELYLQQHPPLSDATFVHMIDTAQRLHNHKLLEQCRVAKARCQETHQLLVLRQNTLSRARDQLASEHGGVGDSSDNVANDLNNQDVSSDAGSKSGGVGVGVGGGDGQAVGGKAAAAVSSPAPRSGSDNKVVAGSDSSRAALLSGFGSRSSKLLASSHHHHHHSPGGELKSVEEEEDSYPVWEPRTSGTPTTAVTCGEGANWTSDLYGSGASRVSPATPSRPSSSSSSSSTPADGSVGSSVNAASPPAGAASVTPLTTPRDGKDSTVIANPAAVQTLASSSPASPAFCPAIPSSPSARLPSRPSPLINSNASSNNSSSPSRQEKPEFKTPAGKGPSKLSLSRTISQPVSAAVAKLSPFSSSSSSSSSSSTSSSSRPGPLKKMLKRCSTAPVPMITSPIIYEVPEGAGTGVPGAAGTPPGTLAVPGGVEGKRGGADRAAKTLSMITGSSDSLPSMPEEDEDEFHENNLNDSITSSTNATSQIKWTPVSVNSHLHHSRTTPTENMADLRLTGSRRTVLLIMSEMIQTERDYTRSIQYVIENYIPELQRVDVPQMLRGKRNVIFGNVEKLYQFHSQYFLRELEACQNNPFLVGHYFLKHESQFHLYTLYNKNKPKSDDLMMELGKHFFRQKQLELGDRMDLASYLLKPVQRMGKYALLLKQILKECPETEPEYADLKSAEEMVRFQLRHGNDLLAMDSLREVDVNLQEQGKLLRQDEFLVFQGRKKMIRQVFLFEDLILFSKTRRGRQGQHDIYVYKHSLKMSDIGLTESCGDSGYKFEIWFRRRSLGGNYIMQAPSSEVKRAWVREISRILWHQAIKNRESHINEMASMGIGNKPCMDIQPSCDNIKERSLDVSVLTRDARTRNSIAVSSMDYLRNGSKRPHSIISVSSNSSSNSSHSSLGLFGSLNLAFDPVDSPRHLYRQSMMSNESGIETDHSAGDGDPGGGKPGQLPQATPVSPDRTYPGVLQPRVLNQSFTEPIMTDV